MAAAPESSILKHSKHTLRQGNHPGVRTDQCFLVATGFLVPERRLGTTPHGPNTVAPEGCQNTGWLPHP